jgi:hypothetical protein
MAGMGQWTVDQPTSLEFEDVTALKVRLIAGSVAVLASDGPGSLDIESVNGEPLQVSYESGALTVTHPNLTWDGLLNWLRPKRHSATVTVRVPRGCGAEVGVVSASAVLSGISAKCSVKSVSGGITLDGLSGHVDANTVSGAVEAQGLDGRLTFGTVSGDLTVADGYLERLSVNSVSGDVTADIDLDPMGSADVATVSGEVTLRMQAEAEATVTLHSMSGDVRTEYPGLRASSVPMSHSVTGSLGAGSGHVSVNTVSGRVMLLKREPRDTVPESDEQMEGEAN